MSGNIKPCLFCGATGRKLTLEHVIPRWLLRALYIRGDVTFRSAGELFRVSKTPDIRLRAVCAECNNGWLHDLERAFRAFSVPMLHGYEQFLPQPLQRVAAAWAVKTWLLLERSMSYSRGTIPAEIPFEHFDWIRTNGEPPPMTQVWIGAIDAFSAPEGDQNIVMLATQWVAHPPAPPAGLVGVFTIGCLMFHIYNPVFVNETDRGQALGTGPTMTSVLTPIWPHEVEVARWPPPRVISPAEFQTLWPSLGVIRPGSPPEDQSEAA